MPSPNAPRVERPSMFERTPGFRESVVLMRKTMLPPERQSRWKRMVAAAAVIGGLGVLGYFITDSIGWAILMLVVGIPVVVLPGILLVGMFLESREQQRAAASK